MSMFLMTIILVVLYVMFLMIFLSSGLLTAFYVASVLLIGIIFYTLSMLNGYPKHLPSKTQVEVFAVICGVAVVLHGFGVFYIKKKI